MAGQAQALLVFEARGRRAENRVLRHSYDPDSRPTLRWALVRRSVDTKKRCLTQIP
jgi:hypothetical protein